MFIIVPNPTAKAIIDQIKYITIATVGSNGQPWVTPVAAVHDADYNFYWASWTENQHSKNIAARSNIAIVIYNSTPAGDSEPGVYIRAKAIQLTDEQEVASAALLLEDPYNPSEGEYYLGEYPRRIYKAAPTDMWLNDDSTVNGNFVDVRVKATE
jgi:nitroimidazol reductase NimA-like FMN-containing flavoprotein (pyridoxamine 5'-phosphate oxidase superfamily)